MSCTKEEIERKRLAAMLKRKNKSNSPFKLKNTENSPTTQCKVGPVKSLLTAASTTAHPYARHERENTVPIGKVVSGTICLISEERFEVNPSEFCTPLINVFKSIPSRNYGNL